MSEADKKSKPKKRYSYFKPWTWHRAADGDPAFGAVILKKEPSKKSGEDLRRLFLQIPGGPLHVLHMNLSGLVKIEADGNKVRIRQHPSSLNAEDARIDEVEVNDNIEASKIASDIQSILITKPMRRFFVMFLVAGVAIYALLLLGSIPGLVVNKLTEPEISSLREAPTEALTRDGSNPLAEYGLPAAPFED